MSRFLQNAARILEAAESVSGSQSSLYPEMTILIGPEGGIRMVTQGTGLPLEVLQQEHGAQMVYRVTQQESRVRLEGRAGVRTCVFEAEKPDWAARILLGDGPRYVVGDLAAGRLRQPLPDGRGSESGGGAWGGGESGDDESGDDESGDDESGDDEWVAEGAAGEVAASGLFDEGRGDGSSAHELSESRSRYF